MAEWAGAACKEWTILCQLHAQHRPACADSERLAYGTAIRCCNASTSENAATSMHHRALALACEAMWDEVELEGSGAKAQHVDLRRVDSCGIYVHNRLTLAAFADRCMIRLKDRMNRQGV